MEVKTVLMLGCVVIVGKLVFAQKTTTEAWQGCKYNNVLYKVGQQYMADCNGCICVGSNTAVCTRIYCGSQHPLQTKLESQTVCVHRGVSFQVGDTFMDESKCSKCWCNANGNILCSKTACTANVTLRSELTTQTPPNGCLYNGVVYKVGDFYMDKEQCNNCFCDSNGLTVCTRMFCFGNTPKPVATTTMPRIGCIYNGVLYKTGAAYMDKDGCNACTCVDNNRTVCTLKSCFNNTPKPVVTTTKPQSNCLYNGVFYKVGDTFMDKEQCNTCWCVANSDVICTRMACVTSILKLITSTPKEGKYCEYKGVSHKEGETFKDQCNVCQCSKGYIACTRMLCTGFPQIPSVTTQNSEKGCIHKGVLHKSGENFRDECNTCHCHTNGTAICTSIACRDKASKGCWYAGTWYDLGEYFKDACRKCRCVGDSRTSCAPSACSMFAPSGCWYKNVLFNVGELFAKKCNGCFCVGKDHALCTQMVC